MKLLTEADVANKTVLVRCDFNVPINDHGDVLDDFRLQKSLPTLRYLLDRKAKVVIVSHLGEPQGWIIPSLSLIGVQKKLEELLGIPVQKTDDCIGSIVEEKTASLSGGQVLLLENVRFHAGEMVNDDVFAAALAKLGQVYINDAFADCHRNHASVVAITHHLPSYAGLLLQAEVENLEKVLKNPARPLVAVIGGTKVKTKAAFIDRISTIADAVVVSGLIEQQMKEYKIGQEHLAKIIGPTENLEASDIDDATIILYQAVIQKAKTVIWNGPFGKFEEPPFAKGTLAVAKMIIDSGAFCVVGGGETIEFLRSEKLLEKFSHVSTGGGAMLQFLAGQELPGLKALGYE